ncbi:unnamed protein product [Nesidiocoris tenuis]|uniref:Uncharacterized protein n=1 Tax=Nesidiocoris tenuis TaxID=355587 RepID=A0A6H5HI25_9HEMI|nr:unnamed protein product [Nesidiocoris tenuis]
MSQNQFGKESGHYRLEQMSYWRQTSSRPSSSTPLLHVFKKEMQSICRSGSAECTRLQVKRQSCVVSLDEKRRLSRCNFPPASRDQLVFLPLGQLVTG